MAIYSWQGMQNGQPASGEVEAPNQDSVNMQLQQQGIIVTAVNYLGGEETTPGASAASVAANAQRDAEIAHQEELDADEVKRLKKIKKIKIKAKELLLFTKKFATMVKSGLPIIKTLNMLETQVEHPGFKLIVKQVVRDVESGSTLSQAFEKYPHIFDTVYVNLLRAGEMSGKLTTFLDKLVIQIEKAEKIRSKFKSALMYPTILLCVAVGVIALMMIKVVPVFVSMFSAMGNSLPAPTQMVVDMSDFVRDPARGGVVVLLFIGLVMGVKFLNRRVPAFKRRYDTYVLKIPLFGDIIKLATYAKVGMVEGNLNAAGVPVLDGLDIIKRTMTNTLFIEAFDYIKQGINEGRPLSTLYRECEMFPQTFWQMLAVGEETGNMDDMFEAVTMFYEEEFDQIVDRMSEMLEPIMIVGMGTTVGFIIVAMYMPIFQVGKAI